MSGDEDKSKDRDSSVQILIVDDHPIVRKGLVQLIDQEEGFSVCGEASSEAEAMVAIAKYKPDLVTVDISLKDTSGIELIKDIRARYIDVAILALSMHDEMLYAERTLRAGASGYVMKQEATENVIDAIRRILKGEIYVSRKVAEKMLRKLVDGSSGAASSAIDCLSDRELEVFGLIGQGFGTRQIAEKLHLSVKTIDTYRAHLKTKLKLANADELLQYAIRWFASQ